MSGPTQNAPARPTTPDTIQRLQTEVPLALAMLAGMQLELFTHLAGGPLRATDLAAAIGVSDAKLSRLLYALVVAGLLNEQQGEFSNTAEAAAFLVKGLPEYLGGIHELLSQLWHADLRTAQSIRDDRPAALHDFSTSSDEEMSAMLRGMHPSAVAAGRDLVHRFDFSRCRSTLDIGGGSGGLVAALCEACPEMRGTLFELPRTVILAASVLADTPGGTRVTLEAGDIVTARPRGMHDAVVMRALIQVLASDQARRAIANAAAVTRPGGTIFVMGGGILDNDRTGPRAAVLLNVTLMNLYRAGAAYTEAEHAEWLSAAGCGELRRITLPTGSGIIQATKLS